MKQHHSMTITMPENSVMYQALRMIMRHYKIINMQYKPIGNKYYVLVPVPDEWVKPTP